METRLSEFGNIFIKSVRDNTIFVAEGIINGSMKAPVDITMHQKIGTMSDKQITILREMVFRMIDLSLHNMLFMFEENQDWQISNKEKEMENLTQLSDGLSGELYTSDGWIAQFSEYPPSLGL